MKYEKRFDSRDWEELRPIEAKVGVIPRADGSAMFRQGSTIAYAAVYGPRELFPKFLQNPEKGILRCNYNMLPFSGHGERVKPGGSRRSKEISLVTEKALLPVLNLKEFPNTTVDVFIELPQTDAGTRCAGINAASLALADAGLEMLDLVCAVAVGKVGDKLLVDLTYDEEAFEPATDIPIAVLPNLKKISLLQMDGQIEKEELRQCLKMAFKACEKIYRIQVEALKAKFSAIEHE